MGRDCADGGGRGRAGGMDGWLVEQGRPIINTAVFPSDLSEISEFDNSKGNGQREWKYRNV